MGVDFKPERKADIDALFNTLEGKLQVIEPLPEPPRGAIGTELGEGIFTGWQYDDVIYVVGNTIFFRGCILGGYITIH